MDGSFLPRAFLVFCISCSSLRGTGSKEDTADDLESLKVIILHTISVWETYGTALLRARIERTIQAESDPFWPDEFKKEGWERMQEYLQAAKESFRRNIEEADSLIHFIQEVKDAPRPEGRLDVDGNLPLLEAERDYLLDTDPRLRSLA
ncbi:MAG: hypothetical protein LBD40_02685 [Puniceicoccales bacterium]|jgi:hypothetical protein|nr:hypothetical protein [Puniceicoccales bacterium]